MIALNKAAAIAEKIVDYLKPGCEIIQIAGSIRRQKPEVKDIEIVCVPKKVPNGQIDVFTNIPQAETVHPLFLNGSKAIGKVLKGEPLGRYMQIQVNTNLLLDLFITNSKDYYRQLAIRTGSADYSKNNIAGAWVRNGWCGTVDGLRLQSQCLQVKNVDKIKWVPNPEVKEYTLPPEWKSEREFFNWLGVQYLEPKYRTV